MRKEGRKGKRDGDKEGGRKGVSRRRRGGERVENSKSLTGLSICYEMPRNRTSR